jgi:Domain of unknown function (DUF4129)
VPLVDRSRVVALVVGSLVALLLVTVATADPVPIADRAPTLPFNLPELTLSDPIPTTTDAVSRGDNAGDRARAEAFKLLTQFLESVLFVAIVAAIGYLTVRAWRNRPQLRWRRLIGQTSEFVVFEDVAASVAADAETQLAILRRGEARNAIVECWLRLEALVAATGLDQHRADTSEEFTARVLGHIAVDTAAIGRLAALYREARFSTHVMGESHRAAAIDALDAIHRDVRSGNGRPGIDPSIDRAGTR